MKVEPGHHQAYLDVIRTILRRQGFDVMITDQPRAAVAHRGPVLIMHFEQYTRAAHLVTLARAVLGRRTAALVFRSREIMTSSNPLARLKHLLLRIERRIPTVSMMAILPLALLPGSERLFRSWIHDPQLWDVPLLPEPSPDRALADEVRVRAAGRPVLVTVGLITEYKGVDMLAALASDAAFCARYLLVIAGRQDAQVSAKFAGAQGDCLIENRYVSDGELYALYEVADFVWAVYAPSYDQASGVFGRAVQFGRTPVVRENSLIDEYATSLCVSPVRLAWDATPAEVAAQLARSVGQTEPRIIGEDVSTTALLDALIGEHRG